MKPRKKTTKKVNVEEIPMGGPRRFIPNSRSYYNSLSPEEKIKHDENEAKFRKLEELDAQKDPIEETTKFLKSVLSRLKIGYSAHFSKFDVEEYIQPSLTDPKHPEHERLAKKIVAYMDFKDKKERLEKLRAFPSLSGVQKTFVS